MLRGEVWLLTLDNKLSAGEGAADRVIVVLSSDALSVLPLRVVVPLIPWQEAFAGSPWLVRVPPVLNSGLEQVMAADALQVRSVSSDRLTCRLGDLPSRLVNEISDAVRLVIDG